MTPCYGLAVNAARGVGEGKGAERRARAGHSMAGAGRDGKGGQEGWEEGLGQPARLYRPSYAPDSHTAETFGGRCNARYRELLTEPGGPELESLACGAGPVWRGRACYAPASLSPPGQNGECWEAAAEAEVAACTDADVELACRQDHPKVRPGQAVKGGFGKGSFVLDVCWCDFWRATCKRAGCQARSVLPCKIRC